MIFRQRIRQLLLAFITATLFLVLFVPKANAQYTEYEIKASLVFTFMKYATWNESSFDKKTDALVLSIYGTDPFGDVIDRAFRGRTIQNRIVEIRRADELKELRGSHVVFISRSEEENVCKVLKHIEEFKHATVLTIGDNIENFCEKGGMVKINASGNYYFNLNINSIDGFGPLIDTRFMKMAKQLIKTDTNLCP